MYCQNCGQQYDESCNSCPRCGAPRQANIIYVKTVPKKANGMAIAGFVLSLLGFLSAGLTFILEVLGFIFSCVGLSRARRVDGNGTGLAVAGIILGVLAFVFGVWFSCTLYND